MEEKKHSWIGIAIPIIMVLCLVGCKKLIEHTNKPNQIQSEK